MVRTGELRHTFNYRWEEVTAAFWQRYPNPRSPHVSSEDTVRRTVDTTTGKIAATRIVSKTNPKPWWFDYWLPKTSKQAFVVEESVLDARAKTLTTRTRNINLNYWMQVEERCIYRVAPDDPGSTECQTTVEVTSSLPVASLVESFGLNRFRKNSVRSKGAIEAILESKLDNNQVAGTIGDRLRTEAAI